MIAALRLALLASALAAAGPGAGGPPAPERPEPVARLRFAWRAPLRARVTFRRARLRPGAAPAVFTARYETRVEAAPGGLLIGTRGTTWRGDLPFPRAVEREAIRASEAIVQRVEPEGRFAGLEGVEAMRPVLARVFEEASVPPDAAARATPLAEAALRVEAEELWNLAVGFWSGADLRVGESYALASEGEIPLVPGARAPQRVEFAVRRRVPCAAGERAARCVEATLRQTPDRAAVERAAEALLARLLPEGAEGGAGASGELAAEGELLLVTDPDTLLPRRLVWTKAVRLGPDDRPPRAELVDRLEYDWRWLPPEPPPRPAARRRPAPNQTATATGTATPISTPTATATPTPTATPTATSTPTATATPTPTPTATATATPTPTATPTATPTPTSPATPAAIRTPTAPGSAPAAR
ncbi:MAG TPA: hypothetical protein VFL83_02230 [Anaeromyxobacter sp.]|nr:hypothetical protein [Anaeromyxobacter sp.]